MRRLCFKYSTFLLSAMVCLTLGFGPSLKAQEEDYDQMIEEAEVEDRKAPPPVPKTPSRKLKKQAVSPEDRGQPRRISKPSAAKAKLERRAKGEAHKKGMKAKHRAKARAHANKAKGMGKAKGKKKPETK